MSLPLESTNLVQIGVPYCLGIDEAGRGPVLGPMVYGCSYCPISDKKAVEKMGFADSKTLTEGQRGVLFTKIRSALNHNIGFEVNVLSPQSLSHDMLKINKYNLNNISHDAAIHLIKKTLAKGVSVQEIYVDTVGNPAKYQAKLANFFPSIPTIIVCNKADSIYPIVSAASICAKVVRDDLLKKWKFDETEIAFSKAFGSGYPGDPITKKWLKANIDPVFGYPSIIRFSWKTCDKLLESGTFRVLWKDDEEEEEETWHKSPKKLKTQKDSKKAKITQNVQDRFRYFGDNNIDIVTDF